MPSARSRPQRCRTHLHLLVVVSAGLFACDAPSPECQGGPPWPDPSALHEPPGLQVVSDQAWNAITGDGWSYLRRASRKNDDICISDPGHRSALRIVFTPGMTPNSEPSVHWIGLRKPRAVFAGWWVKVSPNWTPSPAGGGKISFLHTPSGQVYSNLGGPHAPHRIDINTEWAPYGQQFWEPNVDTTQVFYGQWYRIEWYAQWESRPGAGDGILRWWVNGTLNGNYTNVHYPSDSGFNQFEFAPTRQVPPVTEQYMYIGHTHLSALSP